MSASVSIGGSSGARSGLAPVCNHMIYEFEYTSSLLIQNLCFFPQHAFRVTKFSTDLPTQSNGNSGISEVTSFRLVHSLRCYSNQISVSYVFPCQICALSCLTLSTLRRRFNQISLYTNPTKIIGLANCISCRIVIFDEIWYIGA